MGFFQGQIFRSLVYFMDTVRGTSNSISFPI